LILDLRAPTISNRQPDPAQEYLNAERQGASMSAVRQQRAAARALDAIGIDDVEERAYRALLARRSATVEDIAEALAAPSRNVQRILDSLESKGLATHSPERPRRYLPTSPDIALEALIRERQNDLERVRAAMRELKEEADAANGAAPHEQIVELITTRAAANRVFEQLQQTTRRDVICLQRAPVLFSSFDETEAAQKRALEQGVRLRSIADAEFVALPGALKRIRLDMQAGEEVRIFPALPFKMVVVDRRIGLIPLNLREPDGPSLLVRSSALLDALCALFETLWERAAPISFTRRGALRNGTAPSRLSDAAAELIPLLAAGLNDKAVAHELGISSATLNRRVVELMKNLDARTRFQVGWLAALNAFPERCERSSSSDQLSS
jgi:sugar-specific transcriptional regulator TrmB